MAPRSEAGNQYRQPTDHAGLTRRGYAVQLSIPSDGTCLLRFQDGRRLQPEGRTNATGMTAEHGVELRYVPAQ